MPKDIYHSPYNITRKGNTDIHECTHEETGYTLDNAEDFNRTVTIEEHSEEIKHE